MVNKQTYSVKTKKKLLKRNKTNISIKSWTLVQNKNKDLFKRYDQNSLQQL